MTVMKRASSSVGGALTSSARYARLVVLLSAALCVGARPYDDTKGRFHIELAEGWDIAPQFGDLSGMTFRRILKTNRGEAPALLLVHVDPEKATSAKSYADMVERELEKQPGFKRLGEHPGIVGGQPALVREYRMLASRRPKIEKRVAAYYLETGGHVYQLHVESTPRGLQRVSRDVSEMLASFKPTAGPPELKIDTDALGLTESAPLAGAAREGARSGPNGPNNPIGRWVNENGRVLVLGDDGSFALDETTGRFEIAGDKLTLIIPGQGRESFTFALAAAQDTLTLSSANLGEPMVYRRAGSHRTADHRAERSSAGESADGSGSSGAGGGGASIADAAALIGAWVTPTPKGPLKLDLRGDQSFTMGPMAGRWSASDGRLRLTQEGGGRTIEYAARLERERLHLSGGDLDDEVVFSRAHD